MPIDTYHKNSIVSVHYRYIDDVKEFLEEMERYIKKEMDMTITEFGLAVHNNKNWWMNRKHGNAKLTAKDLFFLARVKGKNEKGIEIGFPWRLVRMDSIRVTIDVPGCSDMSIPIPLQKIANLEPELADRIQVFCERHHVVDYDEMVKSALEQYMERINETERGLK